jgi:hypothetical protein
VIKTGKAFLREPHLWASLVMLATSLMILGWARTYPVSRSPIETPVLDQVSLLFWVGLIAGFAALAGLVLTTKSCYAHWLASCLFLLFLSAPQFLYLSWGSDAGALPDLVEYVRVVGQLDLSRDVAVHSYFQWPASILFHAYLADALGVARHTAVQIGFFFVGISVGGGLFVLWLHGLPARPNSTGAAFWGLVLYFAGFYWLLNWQAVPFAFSLALFFPMLALLGRRTWQEKSLLLLFFLVGIESHALYGVWSTAIVAILIVLGAAMQRNRSMLSLLLFVVVAQSAVIIYKNTRFFEYVVHSMQGTYQAFLETGASDRALAKQIGTALSPLSNEPAAAVLKALSWCDLVFVTATFAIGALVVLRHRRVRHREIALFGTGSLHFFLGIVLAAIGTRSLQLVGMVPAFFVADAMAHGGYLARRAILLASLISLLLFPAAIIRSHQMSGNFVKPSNLLVKQHLVTHKGELSGSAAILDEGRIHATDPLSLQVYNPRTAQLDSCTGPYVIVDSPQFRQYVASVAGCSLPEVKARLDQLDLSAFYTSGAVTLRAGQDCREWYMLWK